MGKYNCKVTACLRDGLSVCNYIINKQPDIAFIDISMPLMDGIKVCENIREKHLTTKLVIATAHNEFQFAYKAIKLGIDDYLLKPFSKEELVNTLNKVITDIEKEKERTDKEPEKEMRSQGHEELTN